MRHPRYTDIRVKSQRGLSGLTCIKVGCKGVSNTQTCYPDECKHLAKIDNASEKIDIAIELFS